MNAGTVTIPGPIFRGRCHGLHKTRQNEPLHVLDTTTVLRREVVTPLWGKGAWEGEVPAQDGHPVNVQALISVRIPELPPTRALCSYPGPRGGIQCGMKSSAQEGEQGFASEGSQ